MKFVVARSSLASILSVAAFAACSSTSGVHRIGEDSFTVTVEASPAKGGRVAAQRLAYEEAAQHCSPGKVERLSEVEPERVWGQTASQLKLDFKCVRAL